MFGSYIGCSTTTCSSKSGNGSCIDNDPTALFSKNVAFNYKEKNIRCNAVAPGRVETNLRINSEKLAGSKTARDQSIGKWKDIEDKITEGYITNMRKCTPDEIAKVALFLASDEASFVNGSIFVADGGWTSY